MKCALIHHLRDVTDRARFSAMAIFHLSAKIIQRSEGRSAIAAAAYRAASALHDETLGRTFNYLGKTGVIHSEILLPDDAPGRWKDREILWNEVEQVERRKDASLAREIELALPRELSQAEAIALARDFAREQFVARGMVADLNIHWGHSADGEAQPHAHIMLTMRQVVPGPAGRPEEGAFGLKERAWNERALLMGWRTRWAELANERLAALGLDARIDHRSNAARGIDLEPQNKIGPAGARRDARGEDAERADEHRAIARRNGEKMLGAPELALQVLTRQQSTFTRADLARLVHRHSDGAAQFAAIMAKVEASPELVRVGKDGRGRERFSTREMIEIERQLIATATALNQSTTHRVNDKRRSGVVNGKHKQLSAEQVLAYLHITRSRDLTVVVGIAGGGKSTMLGAARQVWEGEGYRVRGAALAGIAAEGLQGSAGIESRTIASWEYAWEQGKETLTARDVLVVDEAGMIGSRQLSRLMTRVHRAGAKLVLVGDVEQLQSIEAGAAFRAIVERVGVIAITEPRRQLVDWQRLATKELATARTGEALDRYQMAGLVQRHATREEARAGVIAAWQAARERHPEQSQLILAHERIDVLALNAAARAVRRAAGELGADQVLETEAGRQTFAEGDRIYFLRNECGLGVKNGTLGTLTRIEDGRVTVRLDEPGGAASGKEVTFDLADYAEIGHGYAATIHKNQGATVDQAHVLATPGMDRHLTYVAMSRHRHAVRLHWSEEDFSSPARLRDLLGRERAKDTTLDYAEPEMDPVAAYAEVRGLEPIVPASAPAPVPVIAAPESAPPLSTPAPQPVADPGAVLDRLLKIMAGPAPPEPEPVSNTLTAGRLESYLARRARQDARNYLAPMVPAVPYRPVTDAEINALAGEPVKLRDHMKPHLADVYRDPDAAWVRLDELLQAHGSGEKVAAILRQQGPEALGRLRGSQGIFSSQRSSGERWVAEIAAKAIPGELTHPRKMHQMRRDRLRDDLEIARMRGATAIPGLTPEALAAAEGLKQAGAGISYVVPDPTAERMTPYEIEVVGKVGPLWASIQADRDLAGELAAFQEASEQRIGDVRNFRGTAMSNACGLLQTLNHAKRLAARHEVLEAARISQEQAEAVRQEAAGLAEERRKQAILQAERRSRPRSSGPGPGMG